MDPTTASPLSTPVASMSEAPGTTSPTSPAEAQNAHGLAISQLVSPPPSNSSALPPPPPSNPIASTSTSPPPPPPAPVATSAESTETTQKDTRSASPPPSKQPIEGEAILQPPPGQSDGLNGLPTSDARSEKMDVDPVGVEMNGHASHTNGVDVSSSGGVPPPTTGEPSSTTPAALGGQQGAGSLKRSSSEDASRDERSPKRVKDDEDGREGMQVDMPVGEGAVDQAASVQKEETAAAPPPPPPASSQDAPASSSSATQVNGSQPDPTHPVSDPALLPPQNLYLPGTYLPPTRPPLGSTSPLTYPQYRSLMSLIKSIKKQKDSFAFVAPVDPVALNIPHYFSIIQHPMDLGTVEQRLTQSNPAPAKSKGPGSAVAGAGAGQGPYRCVADVVADVRKVWMNTRIFNGPQHVVSMSADRLEEMFESQLEKLKLNENLEEKTAPAAPGPSAGPSSSRSQDPAPTMEDPQPRARRPSVSQPTIRRNPSDEFGESSRPKREIHPPTPKDSTWVEPIPTVGKMGKGKVNSTPRMKAANKAINDLLTKAKYKMAASPFYVPVDPIALGIPAYHEVIKRPMDLSTIANKIASDQYADVSGVDKDIKLMVKNCFTFNPPGTPVHVCGEQLQKFWNEKWREVLAVPENEPVEEDPALDRELEQLERQQAEIAARIEEISRLKSDKGKQKARPMSQSAWPASKPAKSGPSGQGKPPGKLGRPAKNGGAGAGAGPGKPKKQNGRRPSDAREYGDSDGEDMLVEVPTLAQKQELADRISDADPDTLMKALELIQRTTSLGNHNDEIELDIDALPPGTIAQLYNLVIKGIEPGQAPPRKKKTGPKPGQNGQRHQDHAGGHKRPGKKAGGMGGGGKGGGGGKNQSEAERIKLLEAELSRLNQAQGPSSDEGSWGMGHGPYSDVEENYEGAYSEEEG